jgi:hypothetical protein
VRSNSQNLRVDSTRSAVGFMCRSECRVINIIKLCVSNQHACVSNRHACVWLKKTTTTTTKAKHGASACRCRSKVYVYYDEIKVIFMMLLVELELRISHANVSLSHVCVSVFACRFDTQFNTVNVLKNKK